MSFNLAIIPYTSPENFLANIQKKNDQKLAISLLLHFHHCDPAVSYKEVERPIRFYEMRIKKEDSEESL